VEIYRGLGDVTGGGAGGQENSQSRFVLSGSVSKAKQENFRAMLAGCRPSADGVRGAIPGSAFVALTNYARLSKRGSRCSKIHTTSLESPDRRGSSGHFSEEDKFVRLKPAALVRPPPPAHSKRDRRGLEAATGGGCGWQGSRMRTRWLDWGGVGGGGRR
jgi:hypothetical protein